MIAISGTKISITKGDCQPFTITFTGEDVPENGTKVLFTVKRSSSHPKPLIEKELSMQDAQVVIRIMNADTKELPFGRYEWDIRFPDYYGESEPYTPMEPAEFSVLKVIGNV